MKLCSYNRDEKKKKTEKSPLDLFYGSITLLHT